MTYRESGTVIGFSGFDLFEECYEYNEDACYVADTHEAAATFMENAFTGSGNFRIDAVTIADIMNDFGSSCGEFAMESGAFRRFSAIASTNGIRFQATPYDGDESLMVVDVEGAKYPDDEA